MARGITRRSFVGAAGAGIAALTASSLLGCSSSSNASSAEQTAKKTNEVTVSMTTTSEPEAGFDPLFSWGCGEHVHEPLIQSTLITTDTDLNFVNDLATSYECSEDGLTWTFNIRDDVKFTDGEPLTAHDVAFTINGINSNEAAQADLSMIDTAVATSDTCVQLHLNKPYNAMLYTLAVVGIVPEHAYDAATYGTNPIGSGRYMLEQWDRGQQVILKANPDYYGDAPLMERLIVVFMGEDASLAAANSGQIDVAYTAATMVDSAHPTGYEVLNCESVDSRGISLPAILAGDSRVIEDDMVISAGNNVTSDIAVRRAINFGVDRQKMIDSVLNGYGSAAYSVSDGMPWYNPDMEVSFDAEAAKKCMEDAGWVLASDGIYAKDGQRAAFDCYYSASDSVRQALTNEFANQMRDIGIEVNPVGSGWTYDASGIYAHQYSDPVLWGWGSNSPVEVYMLYYGDSSGNYACYKNAQVDKHLDAALAATSVDASYPEWQAAQWDGVEGVAPQGAATWVWLCNVDHLYFKRENLVVAAQKPHPHGHGWSLVNNVDKWYWE
ncbi:ABC transporter substrate-binding protein [Adlercreutzia sp. ZJ304]|uniref:ABC transporter substrate-binding protein n=1 Tax=Adlercreutzia sp. ZJ304 TaxID=2709791 RepID=UPI0013ED4A05|nr:ABC transporter substrate-binding protein [Adlercreutzia sp. ZJ304]